MTAFIITALVLAIIVGVCVRILCPPPGKGE